MSAPTWEQYMIPTLRALSDGVVRQRREVYEAAAELLNLGDYERSVLLGSGQKQWENRAGWALSYLKTAGAVDNLARGRYQINQSGRDLLARHPD